MTVRKASELLITERLLERRPGKGLYVSQSVPLSGHSVQVVAGNLLWETSLQMSRGVQSAAKEDGIQIQLYDAHGDIDLDLELIHQLPTSNVKGAVIISLHSPRFNQAICRLNMAGFPFVLLDHRMRDFEVSSVTADNHDGGYQVGSYLAKLGHRRVAFIGDLIAATVQDRLSGLRDGLADAGVPFRRTMTVDLVVDADRFGDWSERVNAGVNRLMTEADRPTAIFCSCDGVAKQVYKALAAAGYNVPRDVSVIGYDDDPIAEYLTPALTSVRQPFMDMGRAAMELLKRKIADPTGPAEFRVLPVELVQRSSVKAVDPSI